MEQSRPPRMVPESVRRYVEFFAGQHCEQCGRVIDGQELIRHLDHIVPFSRGGQAVISNMRALCHLCNLRKAASLDETAQQLLRATTDPATLLYFQRVSTAIIGNPRLRDPQIEAYLQLRDYFAQDSGEAALVEIPTGCGKSGIICLAPYGVSNGRVLVVTPNLTIKSSLMKSLDPASRQNFLLQTGVIPDRSDLPSLTLLQRGQVNFEDCYRSHMLIANVQQMQGWLHMFAEDFFDLIIVDEAHHAPADSWQRIQQAFPHAKKLYLTATPFRSDGRPVPGQLVYRYTLAAAMSRGYVKNVIRADAVPEELYFTVDGDTRRYTTDEVLELRDEEWFSRGVALSEASNVSIVDKSIGVMADKREQSGYRHQIIAAACSVRHAEQVVALYNARGIKAILVHSQMHLEERERRMLAFEEGKFDCIVQVGILGEGYDHPPLSIAAVFRPYRTLAPYAQFVGRTLRHIAQGTLRDNQAHVISHVGLNLDRLWLYFKDEIREAGILSEIEPADLDWPDDEGRDAPDVRRDRTAREVEVQAEVISRFEIDSFLPIAPAARQRIEQQIADMEQVMSALQAQGLRVPNLREQLQELNRDPASLPVLIPVQRPDLERREYRRALDRQLRSAAGCIARTFEVDAGRSWVERLGQGDEKNNYEVVVRRLHRTLNARMAKDPSKSQRNEWTLQEFKDAMRQLDAVRDELIREFAALLTLPADS
jgi:DNA repair protein RadD